MSGGDDWCSDPNTCADLNGEWIVSLFNDDPEQCSWHSGDTGTCYIGGGPTWILGCDEAAGLWTLETVSVAGALFNTWTKPIAEFNCLGPNVMNLDQFEFCDGVPASITVEPV